jgi:hypothetical protein
MALDASIILSAVRILLNTSLSNTGYERPLLARKADIRRKGEVQKVPPTGDIPFRAPP